MRSIFGILTASALLVSAFAGDADAQFRRGFNRGGAGWSQPYYSNYNYGGYNSYNYGGYSTPYYYNQGAYGQPTWGTNSYYSTPYSSNYGYNSYNYGGYNTPYYGGYNNGGFNNGGYNSGYYNPGINFNTPLGNFNIR